MFRLEKIHRPKTIEQALELLKQPGTAPLAGGTGLVATPGKDLRSLVDLSELGLRYIRDEDGAVAIGATTTLADLVESPILRAAADGVVAQAALHSASSLLRNQASVVGTLIEEPGGILAACLLALDAQVVLVSDSETKTVTLSKFLEKHESAPGRIVKQVTIAARSLTRRAAIEAVARTPRDRPIVSVSVALELDGGLVRSAAIVLLGVGSTAVRAVKAERTLVGQELTDAQVRTAAGQAAEGLSPPSNPLGSAEYRREMARVLVARALRGAIR